MSFMKTLRVYITLLILGLLTFSGRLIADPAIEFNRATELYKKQNFEEAIKIYEKLIAEDKQAVSIYYNLGNCYYKNGNTAKAILNYERALKLKPGDEDALFNLKLAKLKIIDKIDELPELFYKRWMHQLSLWFSPSGWAIWLILCSIIIVLFACLYVFSIEPRIKKTGFIAAVFFLLVAFFSWSLSEESYRHTTIDKFGIIMNPSAYIKSSPADNNPDLFILHEGTKIQVLDEYENWMKIRIANGNEGWIKSGEISLI